MLLFRFQSSILPAKLNSPMSSSASNFILQMRLKFAANLNWLFKEEANFVARYKAASSAGFKYVESAEPYQFSLDELVAAKNGARVEHVLMNVWPGKK